jgi:general secretion pathway protein K
VKNARGVALITALLVVAIATLAATAILASANASVHRTASLRDSEQAWWYAQGVESWVLGILAYDATHSNDHDGFDEPWAQPVDYLPVDEGAVRGQVVDLQGRFNLNNLRAQPAQAGQAQGGQQPHGDVYGAQFLRLLRGCDCLEADQGADTILRAVRDWMAQTQSGFGSDDAKDSYYLGLTPPYRTGSRLFAAPSELLAVRGVTPKVYAALRPFITALPSPKATPVNVNTAPVEVLRSLSDSADDSRLTRWVKRVQNDKHPATSVNEFISETGSSAQPQQLSVKTNFFQIRGEVFVGTGRLALYSLVYRPDSGAPFVLSRDVD